MKQGRFVIVLLLLALLFALLPASAAQDSGSTYGLSAEEYAAFVAANQASGQATSAQFEFKVNFAIEGTPTQIQLAGKGLFSRSADNPLLQLAVTGTRSGGSGMTSIDMEVRLTNGVLYYRDASANGGQWRGQDFKAFVASVQKNNPTFPLDLNKLLNGDFSGFQPVLQGFQAQMPNLKIGSYIRMARKDNHYGALLDLGGLIADKEVRKLLIGMARAGQTSGSASSGQMNEQQMANAAVLVALMLKNSRLTVDEWITENRISRAVVTMTLNIDPTQVGAKGNPSKINFRFDLAISGYNGAYTVAAPENAVMAGG